ncbi:apolipoprotein N-acyltransferase [Solicola sp. PLA-1-18]|uniref:apolipoprotein N-acyltransferase n=1 Tax=Solicola sp. PLA-1-18 TaxID=3380532 RepID=UPI003B78F212
MPTPPARLWLRSVLGLAAGAVVSTGFAPLEIFWTVPPGLVLLVLALHGLRPRQAALVGAVFGIGFLALLVSWVSVLGAGVLVALVGIQFPFYAIFGAAFSFVSRLRGWPLWAALCWVGTEYLRSVVPFGGFPWGRLAFATVGTPLDPWARWVGVAALSGLVFLASALVASALLRRSVRGALVAAAVVVGVVGGGALLPTGAADPGQRLRVAVVQGDVPGTGATGMGQQREVLDNHVRETQELADAVDAGRLPRPDVVLWPENASDIDPYKDAAARAAITSAARAVGAPILVGAILDGKQPDQARNVGIAWDPETGPGQTYDKRHLVPYGEYVPFRPLVDRLVPFVTQEIPRDIVPGDRAGTIDLGGVTLGDMMCFDVVFDNLARDAVLGGAQYLVVQTNNATYTGTSQPEQQWQIARMRAIEAGRTVVVPSTNGISGIADADGAPVARTTPGVPDVLDREITTATGVTWGTRAGVWVERGLALGGFVAVLAGAVAGRRRRRESPVADTHDAAPAVVR